MTMANLIVQRDRAYLMTDSAYFRGDGTIATFFPKSMVLEPLTLALAMTGSLHLGYLAAEIKKREFGDVPTFLSALGEMLRVAYNAAELDPDQRWCRLVIAFYSHKHGRAYGGTLFSSPEAGPQNMAPWQVHAVSKAIMPSVDETALFGRNVDLLDAAAFDPARDAMPLIVAQRRKRTGWTVFDDACLVAGDIDLTTVSSSGVAVECLHTFPDVVDAHPASE